MKCKTVKNRLIFFIDGEITGQEYQDIKNHLKECAGCNTLYGELKSVLSLTQTVKTPEPNPFLYTRIKQKLEEREYGKKQKRRSFSFGYVLQPVLLSAFLIFGILGGIKLGNMYETAPGTENISQATEYYINDMQQEKLEMYLIAE